MAKLWVPGKPRGLSQLPPHEGHMEALPHPPEITDSSCDEELRRGFTAQLMWSPRNNMPALLASLGTERGALRG